MDAFFTSLLVVAIAEMGDKTQLLAMALAARYRRPLTIGAGMITAILLNHTLAGGAGTWLAQEIPTENLRWLLALSFFGMAVWVMIPDQQGPLDNQKQRPVFVASLIAFFLAEMGDKTQIATVALAARFDQPYLVIAGTTLGLIVADGPVLWLSAKIRPNAGWLRAVHILAAALFIALGIGALSLE